MAIIPANKKKFLNSIIFDTGVPPAGWASPHGAQPGPIIQIKMFKYFKVRGQSKMFFLYTLYVIVDVYLDVCKVLSKNIRFFFVKMYIDFLRTSGLLS